jgi:methyl acetate hydrolase
LTLVDRGVLSLDTDMTALYPPLKEASKRILTGFKEDGEPFLKPNDKPITLLQMLNQSSGFGMEFGETVQAWKKVTPKGKGYVNSCKVVRISERTPNHATDEQENLIHTPICYEPGTVYEYGNSAEYVFPFIHIILVLIT